jgi:hypothetical protein
MRGDKLAAAIMVAVSAAARLQVGEHQTMLEEVHSGAVLALSTAVMLAADDIAEHDLLVLRGALVLALKLVAATAPLFRLSVIMLVQASMCSAGSRPARAYPFGLGTASSEVTGPACLLILMNASATTQGHPAPDQRPPPHTHTTHTPHPPHLAPHPCPQTKQTQPQHGESRASLTSSALLRVLLGDHTALLLFMGTAMQQVLAMEAATQAAFLASLVPLTGAICSSPVRLGTLSRAGVPAQADINVAGMADPSLGALAALRAVPGALLAGMARAPVISSPQEG